MSQGRVAPYDQLLASLGATPEERRNNFALLAQILGLAEKGQLPVTGEIDFNDLAKGLAYIAAYNIRRLLEIEPIRRAHLLKGATMPRPSESKEDLP